MKRDKKESLQAGAWFNQSSGWLKGAAVLVALGFVVGCVSIAYYVAQYFVCIGNCQGSAPLVLVLISTFFGLIPAVGTGALGYFIARGLWEDAQQVAKESEEEREAASAPHRTQPAKS